MAPVSVVSNPVARCPVAIQSVPARWIGLLAYAAQVFLATFWMAPAFSLAQGLAKLRMRATAAAIFLLVINVLGLGLLPALVGATSDAQIERPNLDQMV